MLILQLPPSTHSCTIWGVVYQSARYPGVVGNFAQEFRMVGDGLENGAEKVEKICLSSSGQEDYIPRKVEMNIGLKYSAIEESLSFILYKCDIVVSQHGN